MCGEQAIAATRHCRIDGLLCIGPATSSLALTYAVVDDGLVRVVRLAGVCGKAKRVNDGSTAAESAEGVRVVVPQRFSKRRRRDTHHRLMVVQGLGAVAAVGGGICSRRVCGDARVFG